MLFHQCIIVIVDVEIPATIYLRIDQMSPMKIFHPQEDQPAPGDAVEELLNFRGDLHIFEVLRIVPGPEKVGTGWEKKKRNDIHSGNVSSSFHGWGQPL